MRLFAVLAEELESRPDDADRVAALARYLRAAGRDAGALAGDWLVHGAAAGRPARLTQAALAAAASALATDAGMSPWLFDVGRAASAEAAEATALLLPWPGPEAPSLLPSLPARPSLGAWQDAWRAAASLPAGPARAEAVARTIAALDDPLARRWAVRAVCGLARPLASEWQWQRAWAAAFEEDVHGVAWHGHRPGTVPAGEVPRPRGFAELHEAPDDAHAMLLDAWRRGELWAEPRWNGWRVQVVRQGADVAVWRRAGPLLNAILPPALLARLLADALARWPDPLVVEAVLVARRGGRGVAVAQALAARPSAARRQAVEAATQAAATLHLVLADWHRWGGDHGHAWPAAERRERLHTLAAPFDPAGPDPGPGRGSDPDPDPDPDPGPNPNPNPNPNDAALPAVFGMPALRPPAEDARPDYTLLRTLAASGRDLGWNGLVLRRHGLAAGDAPHAWVVRAPMRRVRAVLQYVPGEALGAVTAPALAAVACGFALWNRAPLSDEERHAAMTASLAGEFLPPPTEPLAGPHAEPPDLPGLRLLPLARLPIALPEDELLTLHAWLRANTGQRFGAMHAVAPVLVFEIGFARASASRRHRLGAVLEGARVLRWLAQAPPGDAHLASDLAADLSTDLAGEPGLGGGGRDAPAAMP